MNPAAWQTAKFWRSGRSCMRRALRANLPNCNHFQEWMHSELQGAVPAQDIACTPLLQAGWVLD